jgi:antitoxin ParD1/3/4
MAHITLSLPDELAAYIQEQVATGYFVDADEFIIRLLEYDREQNGRLRELLAEGERSGSSDLSFDQIIERARERARSRAA